MDYLKLFNVGDVVWSELSTTGTDSLNVTFPASAFPAPGIYRIRLTVFDAAFDRHTTYGYFTVLPP